MLIKKEKLLSISVLVIFLLGLVFSVLAHAADIPVVSVIDTIRKGGVYFSKF